MIPFVLLDIVASLLIGYAMIGLASDKGLERARRPDKERIQRDLRTVLYSDDGDRDVVRSMRRILSNNRLLILSRRFPELLCVPVLAPGFAEDYFEDGFVLFDSTFLRWLSLLCGLLLFPGFFVGYFFGILIHRIPPFVRLDLSPTEATR